jgi:heme-degrading monooxygenase HmoA
VFAYEVDTAATAAFEAAYGPDGEWARFFRGGDGYLGTELWRAAGGEARYLLVDRWRTAQDHAAFLAAHDAEYRGRSRAAEALYRNEVALGRFAAVS